MNRFTRQIRSYWQQTGAVIRNEFHTVFTDKGVILILVFALLIYATAYSLAYGSQVLRNVRSEWSTRAARRQAAR